MFTAISRLLHKLPITIRSFSSSSSSSSSSSFPSKIPSLLLSSPSKPQSRFFYDLTSSMIAKEVTLPSIACQRLVGASQGFIFSVDPINADLRATNPLTGDRLPIPNICLLTGKFNDSETCRGCFSDLCYVKAIMSPRLDTAVLIHQLDNRRLAFARLAGAGGRDFLSWTLLHCPSVIFTDVIFHKSRLYAVTVHGQLAIFDLDNDPLGSPILYPKTDDSDDGYRSLVESPDGEDLFLLYRGPYHSSDPGNSPLRTKFFVAFKLNGGMWDRVEGIGDIVMFVGLNHSVALAACDFPVLKANCVYFTDDPYMSGYRFGANFGDTGVFDFKDASIKFYPLEKLNWPAPVWYMPAMS